MLPVGFPIRLSPSSSTGSPSTTSTKQDTLMPVWNEQMMSVIAPASTITVSVMDADLGDDDLMFSCEDRAMTAASLRDGMTCFGTGALAAAHVDLKFLTQ